MAWSGPIPTLQERRIRREFVDHNRGGNLRSDSGQDCGGKYRLAYLGSDSGQSPVNHEKETFVALPQTMDRLADKSMRDASSAGTFSPRESLATRRRDFADEPCVWSPGIGKQDE